MAAALAVFFVATSFIYVHDEPTRTDAYSTIAGRTLSTVQRSVTLSKATAQALAAQETARLEAERVAAAQAEEERRQAELLRQQELAAWEAAAAEAQKPLPEMVGIAAPAPSGSLESYVREAAATYGQSFDDMWRVAGCESTWGQDPRAYNGASGHYGPFQFKTGTWATTPYAGYDINNDYYNSMAAGWMWANGRRSEWACQ